MYTVATLFNRRPFNFFPPRKTASSACGCLSRKRQHELRAVKKHRRQNQKAPMTAGFAISTEDQRLDMVHISRSIICTLRILLTGQQLAISRECNHSNIYAADTRMRIADLTQKCKWYSITDKCNIFCIIFAWVCMPHFHYSGLLGFCAGLSYSTQIWKKLCEYNIGQYWILAIVFT